MSTRGSVAWYTDPACHKMRGVYNHSDSYPTSLGKDVWLTVKQYGSVQALLDMVKTMGDWREMETEGVCEYCGKKAGVPHSISGAIAASGKRNTGKYPDPDCKHHKHTKGAAEQFDPTRDPLFMEWLYVLCPATNSIEIWSTACVWRVVDGCKHEHIMLLAPYLCTEAVKTQMGNAAYCHVRVTVLDVNGSEPDWAELERSVADVRAA